MTHRRPRIAHFVLGAALGCNSVLGIDEASLCGAGSCDGGVPPFTEDTRTSLPGAGGVASNGGAASTNPESDAGTPPGSASPGGDSPGDGELGSPTDGVAPPIQNSGNDNGSNSGGNSDNGGSGSGTPENGDGDDPADPGNGQGNGNGNGGSSSEGPGGNGGNDDDGSGEEEEPPPTPPPAPPPPPPSPCDGRAIGEAFCDGATRIACGASGAVTSTLPCPSIAHCTQASGPTCAACLTGEASCNGAALSVCNAAHSGFDTQACASPVLCNSTLGRCDAPVCQPGEVRCDGAVLQQCNATLTGFVVLADCGAPTACNAAGASCIVCTPNTSRCFDGDTVATCNATGETEVLTDCGLLQTCSGGECQVLGLPL